MTRPPVTPAPMFRSFFLAGFDSSTQLTRTGTRLDMLAATQHDRFVDEDYARLRSVGITTVRDTVRWHRVEVAPGAYDFRSVTPYVRAAHARNDTSLIGV